MYKVGMLIPAIFSDVFIISICHYRGLTIASIGVFQARLVVFQTAGLIKIIELKNVQLSQQYS